MSHAGCMLASAAFLVCLQLCRIQPQIRSLEGASQGSCPVPVQCHWASEAILCLHICFFLFAFHTAEPPAALLLYTVCPGLPPSILALNATWNCSATGAGTKCTATGCTNGTIPLPSLPSLYCQLVNNVFTWDTASLTGACAPNPGPRKSLSFISS